LAKIWDPKTGKPLATLHGHKNTIMQLDWNANGNWILTACRDQLIRLYDIRTMKEVQVFRGHKREVQSIAWHPFHERLFCSGGWEGSVNFWLCGENEPVASMESAHESSVFSLAWHPLGHILASGSNDHTTKFWTRNRPGDPMNDRYNLTKEEADAIGLVAESTIEEFNTENRIVGELGDLPGLPGLGSEVAKNRVQTGYSRNAKNGNDQGKSMRGGMGMGNRGGNNYRTNNRDNRDGNRDNNRDGNRDGNYNNRDGNRDSRDNNHRERDGRDRNYRNNNQGQSNDRRFRQKE
jgi:polyadenylation factor subunit 2